MMARLKWYLDPPSPHKKALSNLDLPLTTLSGSAHGHPGQTLYVRAAKAQGRLRLRRLP